MSDPETPEPAPEPPPAPEVEPQAVEDVPFVAGPNDFGRLSDDGLEVIRLVRADES